MIASLPTHPRVDATEVPFTRLDNAEPDLLEELLDAVRGVAAKGAFTLGDAVERFEEDLAAYCETRHAVGVSSGTAALALALRALEIGPGSEVIVPANSFIATAEAVSAVGAVPVVADVDPDTHLINAEIIARHLGPRVRCVIPVHLFGSTVDLDPILALAQEAGIAVVEDACQALGARYRGRRVGGIGNLGCLSFYPAKNLGAWGDAGAVVTDDPELAERVRRLRSHGEGPRYHHRYIGATERLDAVQAAVLSVKLGRLDAWTERRRYLGASMREGLTAVMESAGSPFSGHEVSAPLSLPAPVSGDGDHVYHLFVVRARRREALMTHLRESGVASAVHYPIPIHRTDAYASLNLGAESRPASERLASRVCSLPLFPNMTDAELDRVVSAVGAFVQDERRAAR